MVMLQRIVKGVLTSVLALVGVLACDPNQTCKEDPDCKKEGKCVTQQGKRCVAGSDADCRASELCRVAGACFAVNRVCQAKSDDDCKKSENCRKSGACGFYEGTCVSLDTLFHPSCAETCAADGLCVKQDGKCVALSKYHCLGSPSEQPVPHSEKS